MTRRILIVASTIILWLPVWKLTPIGYAQDSPYHEAPMLAARVAAGELPPRGRAFTQIPPCDRTV